MHVNMCGVLVLIQRRIIHNKGVERKGCDFCFLKSTQGHLDDGNDHFDDDNDNNENNNNNNK